MEKFVCPNCKKEAIKHAKGLCTTCYKKKFWQNHLIVCKNCGRTRYHKAFGLCSTCHVKLHHFDKVKEYNSRKSFNLSLIDYKKLAEKCIICGFDKVVNLHHLDKNKKNNSESNLISLCPNHHKMLHTRDFQEEIYSDLEKLGFKIPKEVRIK